jgi:hypothetical protein
MRVGGGRGRKDRRTEDQRDEERMREGEKEKK